MSSDAPKDHTPTQPMVTAAAMPVPIMPQITPGSGTIRYPMYFHGAPFIYPPLVAPQAAAMLSLNRLPTATQFPGAASMPAPLGDSSKQVVTKATEVKSESQPQPAAVGIQAVQPIAMGIPMDPTMMQQMLQGTQFLSPVTALSSQPQLAKSGEDHAQHRRPSPASAHHAAEDGEAVVSIVHHTPDQSAIKRDAPVDLTSEVPQRKRPRASAVDGVLSGTPPTLGSPVHGLVKREEPEAANSKDKAASGISKSSTQMPPLTGPAHTVVTSTTPLPQMASVPLTRLVFPPKTRLLILPCVGTIQLQELQACRPYLAVCEVLQNVFKPSLSATSGSKSPSTCYAWSYPEKVTPLTLEACLHLTAMYLSHLGNGEGLNPEKLRALLYTAQMGEGAWLASTQGRGTSSSLATMHPLVNHLTQMGLYPAEGRVVVKETGGHLMDGIRGAVQSLIMHSTGTSSTDVQPRLNRFVIVQCIKESKLSSFCIIACDPVQNAFLAPASMKTGPPRLMSSKMAQAVNRFASSRSQEVLPPFQVKGEQDGRLGDATTAPLAPKPLSTVQHLPPVSHALEVTSAARCLYRAISDSQLSSRGPFRSVDFAFLSPDPLLLAKTHSEIKASGLVQALGIAKSSSGETDLEARLLSVSASSDSDKLLALLSRACSRPRTLFLVVLLQSEQLCGSLLPGTSDLLTAHKEVIDRIQARGNVLFVHLSQVPYSLQTPHSVISADNEFTWHKCQTSVFARRLSADDMEMDDGDGTTLAEGRTGGRGTFSRPSSEPLCVDDCHFERSFSLLAARKVGVSGCVLRAQLLVEDYTKAILQTLGSHDHLSHTSTLTMIQNLLTLPMRSATGRGCMIILRCYDYSTAKVIHKELAEVQERTGLQHRFELLLDDCLSQLQLSPHFLNRLRVWRFGQGNNAAQEWQPCCYDDLEGLPCIVILAGKCRGGLRFPRSLRYVDCRLCFGHTVNRATIEADMNLLYKENTCFLPKETLEEDIHSSVTASSKQVLPPKENATFTGEPIGAFLPQQDQMRQDQVPQEESASEPTGPDPSPGTPSAEKRIQRDFSDSEGAEINSRTSTLSSPRPSTDGPRGVVEWRGGVANAGKQETTMSPAQVLPVTSAKQSEAILSTSKVAPSSTSRGALLSPDSSMSRMSATQGYPAIILVTEPAEESEGVERGSNGIPASTQPHPWSSSLQASFVTQKQMSAVAEPSEDQKQCTSPLSTEEEEPMGDGPAFWDSEEEEEEEATEAELAIGEEYLAIPQMYLLSSTYQHFMEPQNYKIFHEKLLLDPAPNCGLVRTSKRQPLFSDNFHAGSSFYRKWNMPSCWACGFCRWIHCRRPTGRGQGDETTPTNHAQDKHYMLCGPPEVDKVGAIATLIYTLHRELSLQDKVSVRNTPLMHFPSAPGKEGDEDTHPREQVFQPAVQEWFKSNRFSTIIPMDKLEEVPMNGHTREGEREEEWNVFVEGASPEVEVTVSPYCCFDARHSCQQCLTYLKGVSPEHQSVVEMSYSVKGTMPTQLQFFVPKSQLRHFEVNCVQGQNGHHYVLQRLKLPAAKEPARRGSVLTPIFTPTTGRHDVGLLNIHHALDGAEHVHVLVISQSEVTSYRHLWPNHVLMVLPDEERFKGFGAICYWVKRFLSQNFETNCSYHQEKHGRSAWPFALVMSDSCLMWKTEEPAPEGSDGSAVFTEDAGTRDVSLLEVLSYLEANPDTHSMALVGLLQWAEKIPQDLPTFSRVQVDHGFIYLNLAKTTNMSYSRYLYNSADIDYNLRLESAGLLVARCNKFAILKKAHKVGGKLSALQTSSQTETFVVSFHHDSPSLMYYPGPLLLEEHFAHQGKRIFSLAMSREHPILVVDNFVNLGPQVHVVFVNFSNYRQGHTFPAGMKSTRFGGVLLYLCEGHIKTAGWFLQQFKFVEGASLCLVTRDCKSMVKEVARLDLDESWKYQTRSEYQTACPDNFRPLYYLIRKYDP